MAGSDSLVGHDRGCCAGLERRNTRAELADDPPADHDVVGAIAECDVDDRRLACAKRRGHHGTAPAMLSGTGRPARCSDSAVMISLTMVSCATSRDITVTSASA